MHAERITCSYKQRGERCGGSRGAENQEINIKDINLGPVQAWSPELDATGFPANEAHNWHQEDGDPQGQQDPAVEK